LSNKSNIEKLRRNTDLFSIGNEKSNNKTKSNKKNLIKNLNQTDSKIDGIKNKSFLKKFRFLNRKSKDVTKINKRNRISLRLAIFFGTKNHKMNKK
jgi:hypothetical protein